MGTELVAELSSPSLASTPTTELEYDLSLLDNVYAPVPHFNVTSVPILLYKAQEGLSLSLRDRIALVNSIVVYEFNRQTPATRPVRKAGRKQSKQSSRVNQRHYTSTSCRGEGAQGQAVLAVPHIPPRVASLWPVASSIQTIARVRKITGLAAYAPEEAALGGGVQPNPNEPNREQCGRRRNDHLPPEQHRAS